MGGGEELAEVGVMNVSFNSAVEPVFPREITTQTLLDYCGHMDMVALWSAGAGLCLAILALFWFGRFRGLWVADPFTNKEIVQSIDKLLLTLIAFGFAIIIVQLTRAG